MSLSNWDGVTLPYVPRTPIMLYTRNPACLETIRVCVPNHKGEYHSLIKGTLYYEAPWDVLFIQPMPPPPNKVSHGTQVSWNDLPVPPERHLARFIPPHPTK